MLTWLHPTISVSFSDAFSCCEYAALVTRKATEEQWAQCHVYEISLRWLMLCDKVHYHAGCSHWKIGKLLPWRAAHGQQQYSNRLWHLNDDWMVRPNTKHPSHHYTMTQGNHAVLVILSFGDLVDLPTVPLRKDGVRPESGTGPLLESCTCPPMIHPWLYQI